MPISALVSAGASLMPSPTMAVFPRALSSRITLSLPSGKTPAITSSTPARAPMASAVLRLSPVSITTWIPIRLSSFIASPLSSLMVSATAIIPNETSPSAKNIGVLPWAENSSAFDLRAEGTEVFCSIKASFPPASTLPSAVPCSPLPATALKSDTSSAAMPAPDAYSTMAPARGCSLLFSSEYAILKSLSSDTPSAGKISVTAGIPLVMVPVLSRAMICILPASSRETAVLNIIPFLAPSPLPTIIATGVASPRAQGQLITSTEIPLARAYPNSRPTRHQTAVVTMAIPMTTGTNTPETLSAILAMGAFVAAASETIFIICERVVSSPTLVARHFKNPD